MNEIILELPAGIAMEFARRDATNADVGSIPTFFFLTPFDAAFGS